MRIVQQLFNLAAIGRRLGVKQERVRQIGECNLQEPFVSAAGKS